MLQAKHEATLYAKPTFRRQPSERRTFKQVLKRVVAFNVVELHSTAIELNDSDRAGFDDLLRQHEATRHKLMLCKIRGESLDPVQELVLMVLNAELEAHLPAPEKRPEAVTAAVEETKRVLAQLGHVED